MDALEHEWDYRSVEWDLTSDSRVVDCGGYKGTWASIIAEKYDPYIYVFEPQAWAYRFCQARFEYNDKVKVWNYGLGVTSGWYDMVEYGTDGCSFCKQPEYYDRYPELKGDRSSQHGAGELVEIRRAFNTAGITSVDLMMMNIEGYEFNLLQHMISTKVLPKILVVQYHTEVPKDPGIVDITKTMVLSQYDELWTYGDVLTAYRLRGNTYTFHIE